MSSPTQNVVNNIPKLAHYVKSVQIQSFFGPEKNPYLDTFHLVAITQIRTINPAGEHGQTFECKKPNVSLTFFSL